MHGKEGRGEEGIKGGYITIQALTQRGKKGRNGAEDKRGGKRVKP